MNYLCLGLSHQTASVEVRERFAVPDGVLPATVTALAARRGIAEAVILSTCNRVEFYLATEEGEAARARESLHAFLNEAKGEAALPDAPFYAHTGEGVVTHLFRVASGLESMVIGETEIFGQVKKAYAVACAAGGTGAALNRLFQRAFHVAKAARTETHVTRGPVSVGSAAVDLAGAVFPNGLHGCRVMILGAGENSEATAQALRSRGVQSLFVSNRSFDRAAELAGRIGGGAIHFSEWDQYFHDIDILISSTSAPHVLVKAERLAGMMRLRPERPLFVIDLAVPRDVEPTAGTLPGVHLYDIDSLREIVERGLQIRRHEASRCERLIEAHVRTFAERLRAVTRAPDPVSLS